MKTLKYIGQCLILLFFIFYLIGKTLGYETLYLKLLYVAIGISIILLVMQPNMLNTVKGYYRWQFIFICFSGFSMLYTINEAHAFHQWVQQLIVLLKVSTIAILFNEKKDIKTLMYGLSAINLVVFWYLLSTGLLNITYRLGDELFGNANAFALVILIYTIGPMYLMFSEENKYLRLFHVVSFLCGLYAIMLSGGRKFILFIIVFCFLSMIYGAKGIRWKRVIVALIATMVLVSLGWQVILSNEALYDTIGVRLVGLGTSEGALGVDDQSFLMKKALDAFAETPIFGLGVGGFQEYMKVNYNSYVYSHSNYTEILANFGIIGFLIYYIYMFKLLMKFIRGLWKDKDSRLFFPLFCSILIIELFSITYNQTAFIPMFIMIISRYVQEKETSKLQIQ